MEEVRCGNCNVVMLESGNTWRCGNCGQIYMPGIKESVRYEILDFGKVDNEKNIQKV